MASGRVRRARKQAFTSGVVTAIYFHKPNGRLFARCVEWLEKHGYTFISANDLVEWLRCEKSLPPGAVWLSFDDGCRQLLRDVLPLARDRKIPVTLFIPSGIIAGDGLLPWFHANGGESNTRHTFRVDELQEVAAWPEVTIGSHTVNHTITAGLAQDELRFEFGESKRALESWSHTGVTCFAYPVGMFDGAERPALADFGYGLAATTENALVTRGLDPYRVPRFSVADEISFLEAICNMVGVWRPALDRLTQLLGRRPTSTVWPHQIATRHDIREQTKVGRMLA